MRIMVLLVIMMTLNAEDDLQPKLQIEVSKPAENIETFAINGIGYSGNRTFMVELIEGCRESKNAEQIFTKMVNSGSLANALYGLYGLGLIKSEKFNEAKDKVLELKGSVLVGPGGCCVYQANAADAVKYLQKAMDSDRK